MMKLLEEQKYQIAIQKKLTPKAKKNVYTTFYNIIPNSKIIYNILLQYKL